MYNLNSLLQILAVVAVISSMTFGSFWALVKTTRLSSEEGLCFHAVRSKTDSFASVYIGSPPRRRKIYLRFNKIAGGEKALTVFNTDVFSSSSIRCLNTTCTDISTVYSQVSIPIAAEISFTFKTPVFLDLEESTAQARGYDGVLSLATSGRMVLDSTSYCYSESKPTLQSFSFVTDQKPGGLLRVIQVGDVSFPVFTCGGKIENVLFLPLSRVSSFRSETESAKESYKSAAQLMKLPRSCVGEKETWLPLMESACAADVSCSVDGVFDFEEIAQDTIIVDVHNLTAKFTLEKSLALSRLPGTVNTHESVMTAGLVLCVVLLVAASAWTNEESHKGGATLYTLLATDIQNMDPSRCHESNLRLIPSEETELKKTGPMPEHVRDDQKLKISRRIIVLIDMACVFARLLIIRILRADVFHATQNSDAYRFELLSASISIAAQLSFVVEQFYGNSKMYHFGGSLASTSGSIAILTLFSSSPLRSMDFNGLIRLISSALAILIAMPRTIWAMCILAVGASVKTTPCRLYFCRLALASIAWLLQLTSLFYMIGVLVIVPSSRAWAGASTVTPLKIKLSITLALSSLGTGRLVQQCKDKATTPPTTPP